jgi:hypothetical protein
MRVHIEAAGFDAMTQLGFAFGFFLLGATLALGKRTLQVVQLGWQTEKE